MSTSIKSNPLRLIPFAKLLNPVNWAMWLLSRITIKHLKWLATFAPPLAVLAFESARNLFSLSELFPIWGGNLLEAGFVLIGAALFSQIIFGLIEHITRENGRRRREAEALFKVGMEITASLDSDRLLQSIVDCARLLLNADLATLALSQDGFDLKPPVLKAVSGMTLVELEQMRAQLSRQLLVERAVQTGQPSVEEYAAGEIGDIRCRLAVPLWSAERVIGALCLGAKQPRRFSEADLAMLKQLAVQASIVIEKARLQAQAQQVVLLEERERISRELHDGLGQTLSYLALKLEVIGEYLSAHDTLRAQAELEQLRKVTRDTALDVRESILGLRTNLAAGVGRVTVLEHYLTQYRELTGISAELVVGDGAQVELPQAAEVQLLRIVQEALINVRKHAGATQVHVRFKGDERCLCVGIEDNGRGFSAGSTGKQSGGHFGLVMMRERAKSIGGELEVNSIPGHGTRLELRVPTS